MKKIVTLSPIIRNILAEYIFNFMFEKLLDMLGWAKRQICDIDQMTHNYLNEETETIDLGRKTAPSILLLVDATFFTQDITNTNK